MKVRISDCWVWVAVVGYVAARECRKVQVERPSSSTSGGHSGLEEEDEEEEELLDAAVAIDLGIGREDVFGDWVCGWDCDCDCDCDCWACLASAFHEAADVQVRHLFHSFISSQYPCSIISLMYSKIHTVCHLCPAPRLWAGSYPWSLRSGWVLRPASCKIVFSPKHPVSFQRCNRVQMLLQS